VAPPRRQNRFQGAGPRRVRRSTAWSGPFDWVQALSANNKQILVTLIPTVAETTIVRIRGNAMLSFVHDALNESVNVALGLIVVSAQAAAAGATSVPGPITDAGNDGWFWHQSASFMAMSATDLVENDQFRFEIDSKAMRKVNDDQRVLMVSELTVMLGVSVKTAGNFRVLAKLV